MDKSIRGFSILLDIAPEGGHIRSACQLSLLRRGTMGERPRPLFDVPGLSTWHAPSRNSPDGLESELAGPLWVM